MHNFREVLGGLWEDDYMFLSLAPKRLYLNAENLVFGHMKL